jgi:hypothetical protein
MLLNLQVVQIRMYQRNTSYLISRLQFYTSINFYHTSQKAQYKSNLNKEERLGNAIHQMPYWLITKETVLDIH